MRKEEVNIDNRVHSMIIGKGGKGIRKIQQDFKVEIKLPRAGDPNPDMVIVSIFCCIFRIVINATRITFVFNKEYILQAEYMMNSIFPIELV